MNNFFDSNILTDLHRELTNHPKDVIGRGTSLTPYEEYYRIDPDHLSNPSLYEQSFGPLGSTSREKEFLKIACQIAQKQKPHHDKRFVICDFGGGDLRLWSAIEEQMSYAVSKGQDAELIVYDLAQSGFDAFIQKHKQEYDVRRYQSKIAPDEREKALLQKGKKTIRLICGRPHDTRDYTAQLIGSSVDVMASYYGVLNCICESQAIVDTLQMLKKSCKNSGVGVYTAATFNAFPKENEKFAALRREDKNQLPPTFQEEGVIVYERIKKQAHSNQGKVLQFPYHLFSTQKFQDLLQQGGWNLAKSLQIASIGHTYTITSQEKNDQRDALYSRMVTTARDVSNFLGKPHNVDHCFDYYARYLGAIVTPSTANSR